MNPLRRIVLAGFAATLAMPASVIADDKYPSKPIRFVSPAPPGGLSDIIPRALAPELARTMKTEVVVDNKAGAGGTIATGFVARAPADGYTLLLGSGGIMSINPYTFANLPFDSAKDFVGIAMVAYAPLYLAVRADSPYKTVNDLVAAAKAKPGELAYGTIGSGSTAGIASGLLMKAKGIDMIAVPYAGYAPALTELLAGRLAFTFLDGSSLSRIEQGSLRALAVTTGTRSPRLPNVPTLKDAGVDIEISSWFGVYARAGTSVDAVERLRTEVRAAIQRPEFHAELGKLGLEPGRLFGEDFQKFHLAELKRWEKLIPTLNIPKS